MKNTSTYSHSRKVDVRLIRDVIQQIVQGVHPKKIVLFGSYAYGKPRKDSDVDLLVIMNSQQKPIVRTIQVSKTLKYYPFPMDILVRTPKEVRMRMQMGDPFFEDILKKGKILYESKAVSRVA